MKKFQLLFTRASGIRRFASTVLIFVGLVLVFLSQAALDRSSATSAAGTIRTFAGAAGVGPAISIGQLPFGLTVYGNQVYVVDGRHKVVRAINTNSGLETVAAGNGTPGFTGDGGPAIKAQLQPTFGGGVAVDSAGNLYIADWENSRIRKVDSAGVITTIYDQLFYPEAVAVDASDNLFIADTANNRILKRTPEGIVTTVAGGQLCQGSRLACGDGGPATAAGLRTPSGVAVDASGNLYIADRGDERIRKVDRSGIITTVAGNGKCGFDTSVCFSGDGGPAVLAQLSAPSGVTVDGAGNLYIADSFNNRIRKVDSSGIITTVVGSGPTGYGVGGFGGDGGRATAANLYFPYSVALDGAGNIFISDEGNYRIRKVDSLGIITTAGGNGTYGWGGDGRQATNAELDFCEGVFPAANGNVYIADTGNNRLRVVNSAGIITTAAGTGEFGFSGDGGPATAATFESVISVAADSLGNVFITDSGNNRIRKIDTSGIINTVAGDGTAGSGGDGGPAILAQLNFPRGVTVDESGNLFITDTLNHRIRKVDSFGIITTVAGNGIPGFSGDGGPATSAQLSGPTNVILDTSGNLYIADSSNFRIRKVDSSGIITTVAGNGIQGYSGDGGPAILAEFNYPTDVAVDKAGNLFVADDGSNNLRRINTSGIISTIAGDGTAGFGGDGGPAKLAKFNRPIGLELDESGNIYIADFVNSRVRIIQRSQR